MADPIDTGKKTVTGRTIWRDPETGEDYSERSTTFEIDGKYYTMPTVAEDGTQYTEDQIREYVKKYGPSDYITGEELPEFRNREDAIEYAISRSDTRKQKEEPMLEEQMELFNEGGLKDEGGSVDPESGNDVPIGSTKKEVRDDIPAMLSEGEFVFPADVVRFIGLEKLMELRQSAKMGLKQMEAMGQMGNSEEATIPDDMPFNMADLIIVSGEQENDEPREMAQGGVVYANQGTFMPSTGIGGYQQSVFQNQPQTTASFVPPSSVAPPPPAQSPAGGYMPKFMTNNATPFDDGSLALKTNTGTTGTTSTTTANTGTTGTTNDFVPTVDDVYTQKEYFNPETGETRVINFYNGNPVNEIPEGFVLKETYTEDETTTTDLESTSVESTQVRDDNSQDKARLEKMVRDQGGQTQLNKLKNMLSDNKEGGEQAVKDAYIANEKFKSLLTMGAGIIPALGIGRLGAGYQGKQLEKLMEENGIEVPEIEEGFFQRVKGAFSDMFKDAGEKSDTYEGTFSPSSNRQTRFTDKDINFLTEQDRRLYDAAVRRGDVNVTAAFEGKNRRLNKMATFMKDGMSDAEGRALGLSVYDIAQAKEQFEKDTGTILGDSVNEAKENKKAAADKAAADKAARDKRKKYQKEQREKQQKQNDNFTKKKLKEFKKTGKVTGFKEGGLASRKK